MLLFFFFIYVNILYLFVFFELYFHFCQEKLRYFSAADSSNIVFLRHEIVTKNVFMTTFLTDSTAKTVESVAQQFLKSQYLGIRKNWWKICKR